MFYTWKFKLNFQLYPLISGSDCIQSDPKIPCFILKPGKPNNKSSRSFCVQKIPLDQKNKNKTRNMQPLPHKRFKLLLPTGHHCQHHREDVIIHMETELPSPWQVTNSWPCECCLASESPISFPFFFFSSLPQTLTPSDALTLLISASEVNGRTLL